MEEESRGLFHEALAQLQALHETQVASLTAEVARLRAELEHNNTVDISRPADEAPWQALQLEAPSPQPALPHRPRGTSRDPSHRSGPPCALALADGPRRRSSKDSLLTLLGTDRIEEIRSQRSSRKEGWRRRCEQLVTTQSFDIAIGLIIALNAVSIGIESSIARAGQETPTAVTAMEYCFVAVYIVELAMRLVAHGVKALTNQWIQFDVFLAICGLLGVASKLVATGEFIGILGKVLLLRILRLARLARVFRLMTKFNALWLLVHGLMNSLSTLVWTGTVIGILLYIFAVLGLELLLPDSQASEEYSHIVDSHFGSLFTGMLTLLQGLTLDSFSSIYRPIILEKPYFVLYFIPFLLTVSIALMNLVTAIMVNLSLEQAGKDKQAQEQMQTQRKGALADLLKDMFMDLDTDGSDRIDLVEMVNAPDELQSLIIEIADNWAPVSDRHQRLKEIFHKLDFDGSGDIEINEFCSGLLKLQNENALDILRLQKKCESVMEVVVDTVKSLVAGPHNGPMKSLPTSPGQCESEQHGVPSAAGMPLGVLPERPGPATPPCGAELGAPSLANSTGEDCLQV